MNPEKLLISAVIRQKSYATTMGFELTSDMFEVCEEEWAWLSAYMEKHHRVPPARSFTTAFPNFKLEDVDDSEHQAEEVRKRYVSRVLSREVLSWAQGIEQGSLDDVLNSMQGTILSTAQMLGSVWDSDAIQDFKDIKQDVEDYHDRIVDTGYAGIPTGFKTWDVNTGGCKPGEFVVVGARLGSGKSWIMTKMAAEAVMSGYTVLYDSLEMTRTNVTLRAQTLLASATGRPYDASGLMTGTTAPELDEYSMLLGHLQKAVPGKLHVADTTRSSISLTTIAAQIERIQPDIVFIDYLTLMDHSGEWQSVAALSNSVKQLANSYKIPIVAAAQLNRANGLTKGVPGNEALSRSDSIGQDADQVMNIALRSKRVIEHKLVKNRNGAGGMRWFTEFRPGSGVIDEINEERAYELIDEDEADS